MPRALITGISGQDGSYLAEYLLEKGYEVYGISKNTKSKNLEHIASYLNLYDLDIKNEEIRTIITNIKPDELYHLASESHITYDNITHTVDTIAKASIFIMSVLKESLPECKMFQAGSSQMFGDCTDEDGYQRETTPFKPVNPYGCCKVMTYNISKIYRDHFGINISNGLLFNHESIRRSDRFVTTKIVKQAVKIKKGKASNLILEQNNSLRDWSHAKDFVKGMWLSLQHKPDDYVFASGRSNSVEYVCNYVFDKLNLNTASIIIKNQIHEEQIKSVGDASKLKLTTGWNPEYTLESMLDEMIYHHYKYTV